MKEILRKIRYELYHLFPLMRKVIKLESSVNFLIKKNDELESKIDHLIAASGPDSYGSKIDLIFEDAKFNPAIKSRLGQKIIEQGQVDIILNLANNIIKNQPFLIIDVGASDGWFVNIIRRSHNVANSFFFGYEPLKIHHQQLEDLRNNWHQFDYSNKGLGDKKQVLRLKESKDIKGLSSFLDLNRDYRYFAQQIDQSIVDEYDVDVTTLDDEFDEGKFDKYENVVLKIDVQGFEMNVLQGGSKLLKSGKVKAILIEVTTVQKYENSASFKEIFDFIYKNNFVIFDLLPFYREVDHVFQANHNGRLTEFDALFIHQRK